MSDLGFYNNHDLYYFTYEYGNGDSYSGYGYTDPSSTYYTDQILNNYPNETGNNGYYRIDSVETRYGYAPFGRVYVTSYYDGETGYSFREYEISGDNGYSGLGSETGYIYSDSFSNSSELDFIVADTDINNEVYSGL